MKYSIKSIEDNSICIESCNTLESKKNIVIIMEDGKEKTYTYINTTVLYNHICKMGLSGKKVELKFENCYIGNVEYEEKSGKWIDNSDSSFDTRDLKDKYGCSFDFHEISMNNCFLLGLNFYTMDFWKDVKLTLCYFINKIEFIACSFNGNVDCRFNEFYSKANIYNSFFYKESNFQSTVAHENVNMSGNEFYEDINIGLSNFSKEVNLNNSKFKKRLILVKTEICGKLDFNESEFCSEVNFSLAKFKSEVIYNNSKINTSLEFDRTFIENLVFCNIIFENAMFLKSVKCNSLTIINCINRNTIFIGGQCGRNLCLLDNVNIGMINFSKSSKELLNACKSYETEYDKILCEYNSSDKNKSINLEDIHVKFSNELILLKNINSEDGNCKLEIRSFNSILSNGLLLLKENYFKQGRYKDEDYINFWFKHHDIMQDLMINNKKKFSDKWKSNVFQNIKYWIKFLLYEIVGGFGTKPFNVIITMISTIMIFSLIYFKLDIFGEITRNKNYFMGENQFSYALYFSTITFFTIGYGDISPWCGIVALLAGIEGFCGVFLMSYLSVTFIRKFLR